MRYPALWFPCFITSLYTRHWNASQRGENSFKKGEALFYWSPWKYHRSEEVKDLIFVTSREPLWRHKEMKHITPSSPELWSVLPHDQQQQGTQQGDPWWAQRASWRGIFLDVSEDQDWGSSWDIWIFTYRMVLPHLCTALLPTSLPLPPHSFSLSCPPALCTRTIEEKEEKLNGMCLVIDS